MSDQLPPYQQEPQRDDEITLKDIFQTIAGAILIGTIHRRYILIIFGLFTGAIHIHTHCKQIILLVSTLLKPRFSRFRILYTHHQTRKTWSLSTQATKG